MARKSSALSRPAKQLTVNAADIFNSTRQRALLGRLKETPDEAVDLSKIPALTAEQLGRMVRESSIDL